MLDVPSYSSRWQGLAVVSFRAVIVGALFVLPLLPLLAAPARGHSIPWVAHFDYPDEICVEKGTPELGPLVLVNGGPIDRTWTVRGSIRHTRSVYAVGQVVTNNFLVRIKIVMKDAGTGLVVAEAFDYHWSWNGPNDGAYLGGVLDGPHQRQRDSPSVHHEW